MITFARPVHAGSPFRARVRAFISLLALLAAWTISLAAYPDLSVTKPSPEPTLPVEFDIFAPPVDASTPAANAPAISEWTRTGNRDESLVLTGEAFSSYTSGDQGKDTRFLIYGQTTIGNGAAKSAKVQRLDGRKAVITLDSTLPTWSMYLVWPRNSSGYGSPVAMNKTEAWWIGPKYATRGGTTSIFGRNLSHDNGTDYDSSTSWVWIKTDASTMTPATVTSVNPYKVDFTVPSNLANGDYEVWIHNGHGGEYGWSGPLTLTVFNGPNWNGSIFNVVSYGANGNDGLDDTTAISNAYNAAISYKNANPTLNPTIFFPAGTYFITSQFYTVSNIRWLGDARSNTYIKAGPGWVTSYAMFFNDQGPSNIEFKDLTFDSNGNLNSTLGTLLRIRNGSEIRLTNLGMISPSHKYFDFNATNRLYLKGLCCVGTGGFLGGGSQVIIEDSDFYGTNDANSILTAWGRVGLSLTNCTARDNDNTVSTGWCTGRFFNAQGHSGAGSNRDTYIGNNYTNDMTVRPEFSDQNSGEIFMWEGNNTQYRGTPTTATANTATFSGLATDYTGKEAIIVSGKGMGQHRTISAFNSGTGTITISECWRVTPDATSTIIISPVASRCVVYANYLDGKDYAVTSTTDMAAAGVEPYGNCYDFVVAGNTFNSLRTAISDWSRVDSTPTLHQPSAFHLYCDNTIQNCRTGANVVVNKYSDTGSDYGMALLGSVFRNNTFTNITLKAIESKYSQNSCPFKMFNATVFEHNDITNAPQAFDFTNISNFTLYKNSASLGAATYSGSKAMNFVTSAQWPALRENTWTGFENLFTMQPPGPILEVPFRLHDVTGVTGGSAVTTTLTIWNSGTAALNWTASENAPWLSISASSGTISDQNSASSVTVTCNPLGLSTGSYSGVITVISSNQVRKVTVNFTVEGLTSSTISGMKLWLKADAGITSDASGRISAWADQSGNGNHAVQGTDANKPIIRATAAGGKPAVEFDGSNDVLTGPFTNTLSSYTLYTVYKRVAFDSGGAMLGINDGASSTSGNILYQHQGFSEAAPFYWWSRAKRCSSSSTIIPNLDAFHAIAAVWNDTAVNPKAKYTVDGGTPVDVTGDGFWMASDASGMTMTQYAVGAMYNGANLANWGNNQIAEIILFDNALSESNRQIVEKYLADKYALTVATPTSVTASAVSNTQNNVSWTADSDVKKFSIERSPNGTDSWEEIGDVEAASLTSSAISGMKLWLKADAGITSDASGRISAWADQSGNGNHAVQGTDANRPIIRATAAGGKPAVEFDGSNDVLTGPFNNTLTSYTLYTVYKRAAWDENGAMLGINDGSSTSGGNIIYQSQGYTGNYFYWWSRGKRCYSNSTIIPNPDAFHSIAAVWNDTAVNPKAKYTVDGGTPIDVTGDGFWMASDASGMTMTQYAVGAMYYGASLSNHGNNQIAEIILFDSALSESNRQMVERYLSNKYSLSYTYQDVNLAPGTLYYYRVRGVRGKVFSAYSDVVNAATTLSAPASLTATGISSTEIDLSWSDVSGETGYLIMRSPDGTGSWSQVGTKEANATTFRDGNLTDGSTYYYKVCATKDVNSSFTTPVSATTPATIPGALTATANSHTQITLNWIDVKGETGYQVERSPNGVNNWTTVAASLPANTTTFIDSGLTPLLYYYYRVRSFAGGTYSNPTEVVRAFTRVYINFQPSGSTVPSGYLVDSGNTFANRGNGLSYGWNASNSSYRDRNDPNSPDQRYDTILSLLYYGTFTWQIAVPNGTYTVRVVAGDVTYSYLNNDRLQMKVENTTVVDGYTEQTSRWKEGTVQVTVSDGYLTLSSGPDVTAGNPVCFLEIMPAN